MVASLADEPLSIEGVAVDLAPNSDQGILEERDLSGLRPTPPIGLDSLGGHGQERGHLAIQDSSTSMLHP